MLDSYEVNVSTLAIIAVNDKLSRIIEKDKEFFINKSTINIIDESCRYYGSTYEGRCDGTKSLLNYSYKLPIIIEEQLFAVLLTEPVADVTAVLITSICFTVFYKKTLNVMDKNENKFVENEKPSIN